MDLAGGICMPTAPVDPLPQGFMCWFSGGASAGTGGGRFVGCPGARPAPVTER